MKKDLLLEIGVEELPASFVGPAEKMLFSLAGKAFAEKRISFREIVTFSTPSRLALYVSDTSSYTEPEITETQGPSAENASAPEGGFSPAALGFARKQGVQPEELITKNTARGDYLFAVKKKPGEPVEKILPAVLSGIISGLKFQKTMKWELTGFRFARPLRWLLCLYGRKPVRFSVADVKSSNLTSLGAASYFKKIKILSAERYLPVMENNSIIADSAKRKETIRKIIAQFEKRGGFTVDPDEKLLDTVNNLIEYPTLVHGRFDEAFLAMPEVLIRTTLSYHTKLFSVRNEKGKITDHFVGIRNGISVNNDEVRQGYERVVKARLADAKYFFDRDVKIKLAEREGELKTCKYIEGFGSLYDKKERLKKTVNALCNIFSFDADRKFMLFSACDLLKADLVTETVREFPELQGKMGKEFALLQGVDAGVAQVLEDQYLLNGFDDPVPEGVPSRLVMLADRVDSLLTAFSAGLSPSGDQDPYGLRRMANGVVKIIYEDVHITLAALVQAAYLDKFHKPEAAAQTLKYLVSRISSFLVFSGYKKDLVEAATESGSDDPYDLRTRVKLLDSSIKADNFLAFVAVYKRIHNIIRQSGQEETLKNGVGNADSSPGTGKVAVSYDTAAERELAEFIESSLMPLALSADYEPMISLSGALVEKVNAFFSAVMVMDKDEAKKLARLRLLYRLQEAFSRIANFTKIISG